MTSLQPLQQAIGYRFADPALLQLALTHSSCAGDNYERLEFLGDALLDFAIGHYLYAAHPDWAEGMLTVQRAALVSNEHLAGVFDALSLRRYIVATNLLAKPSLKVRANFVESLVGAIYIDGGMAAAQAFIDRFILADQRDSFDYVSAIQHLFRVQYPTGTIGEAQDIGDIHTPLFAVTVYLDGQPIGYGQAASKKNAKKEACRLAWQHLHA